MAGGSGSGFSPLVQSQKVASGSKAFFPSESNRFAGEQAMLSFKDVRGGGTKSGGSFYRSFEAMEEDDLDDCLHQPEKKRRLTTDQVQFLEKSFVLENKLEPERKVQLAKDLGLQPRQIAIWFQNRRARWKTKQLEKDYDTLHASYNALKANYDVLVKERDQLKDQVRNLTDMLQLEGKQGENSDLSRKLSEGLVQIPIAESVSEEEASKIPNILPSKHEEICSAKSDILDSDSPRYADCGHFSLLEPGDASYLFEPDQSDISQDEEDNLSESLIPTHILFPSSRTTISQTHFLQTHMVLNSRRTITHSGHGRIREKGYYISEGQCPVYSMFKCVAWGSIIGLAMKIRNKLLMKVGFVS